MVRSSIPQKQFPIGDPPPHSKAPFPVTQFPNVITGSGASTRSNAPSKGSTVSLDLGNGSIITGEILDYFIIEGHEYVQVRMGNNIYLRSSGNIR